MPAEDPLANLSPFARSLMGLEQAGFLPPQTRTMIAQENTSSGNRTRSDRRMTGYYNPFQTKSYVSNESLPSYASTIRRDRFPPSPRHLDNGNEILPKYTSSVNMEGPLNMLLESCSPFSLLPSQEWREVYVVLRGTAMYIHKMKTNTFGDKKIASAGRLLRKYTLQQAEVGIATDVEYSTLCPLSRLASMIPSIARRRAFEKDPSLFCVIKQFSLRVRAELDQFVLACPMEDLIFKWVNRFCAGIDISAPLDERSLPRQCTMPRRRRRQQRILALNDLTNQRIIEEQQRILQSMYPAFAERSERPTTVHQETAVENSIPTPESPTIEHNPSGQDEENEDIDLSAIAEDAGPESTPQTPMLDRPAPASGATTESVMTLSAFERLSTSPVNFNADGKWAPPHPRTAGQQLRYIRRCTPILLNETPRHSSVLVSNNIYVKPNYKVEVVEEFQFSPPSYEAHDFPEPQNLSLTRRPTQTSISSGQSRTPSGSVDEIQRADTPAQEMHAVHNGQFGLEKSSPQIQFTDKVDNELATSAPSQTKSPISSDFSSGLALLGF